VSEKEQDTEVEEKDFLEDEHEGEKETESGDDEKPEGDAEEGEDKAGDDEKPEDGKKSNPDSKDGEGKESSKKDEKPEKSEDSQKDDKTKDQQKMVPLSLYLEERRKNKQKGNQDDNKGDEKDDEDDDEFFASKEAVDKRIADMESRFNHQRQLDKLAIAEDLYASTDPDYSSKREIFLKAIDANPELESRMLNATNPAKFIAEFGEAALDMEELRQAGSVKAFKEKIRAEVMAELKGRKPDSDSEADDDEKDEEELPESLSGKRSKNVTASKKDIKTEEEESFEDLGF